MPVDHLSQLVLRWDASGKLRSSKPLKPGDQMTLIKGPFANYVAEVEKIALDRRVWDVMDVMGGRTRIATSEEQLPII